MEILPDTEQVLVFLDEVSNNNLRKRSDIGVILELGATFGLADLTDEIIFIGKTIWNLHSTIKKPGNFEAGKEKMIKSLENELVHLGSMLYDMLFYAGGDISERFNQLYLKYDVGSSRNLIDLSHDLAILKDVQSQFKSNKK